MQTRLVAAYTYLHSLHSLNKQGQLGLRFNPLDIVPAEVRIDTSKHCFADTLGLIVLFKRSSLWGFKVALEPQIALTLPADSSIDCKEDGIEVETVNPLKNFGSKVTLRVDIKLEEEGLVFRSGGTDLFEGTRGE